MRTARSTSLILGLAALAMPACSTTTRSVTGVAPMAPVERTRRAVGESIRLSLDEGLRAELRATDAAFAGEAAPALALTLAFEPKVLGYSFHAGQLVLRDGKGAEWRPTSASAGWMSHGACESALNAGDPLGAYVPVARDSCVRVAFDHVVVAGERLELVVAGAAVGKRRLEPLTVAVARTEQTSHKPGPAATGVGRVLGKVLETALVITLAPLALAGGGM